MREVAVERPIEARRARDERGQRAEATGDQLAVAVGGARWLVAEVEEWSLFAPASSRRPESGQARGAEEDDPIGVGGDRVEQRRCGEVFERGVEVVLPEAVDSLPGLDKRDCRIERRAHLAGQPVGDERRPPPATAVHFASIRIRRCAPVSFFSWG